MIPALDLFMARPADDPQQRLLSVLQFAQLTRQLELPRLFLTRLPADFQKTRSFAWAESVRSKRANKALLQAVLAWQIRCIH